VEGPDGGLLHVEIVADHARSQWCWTPATANTVTGPADRVRTETEKDLLSEPWRV
jgi:hypothetical protein